jgi:hypothetical protein
VTYRTGRKPGQDVPYLIVGQWRALGPTQDCEYIRSRSPTFLMPDQGEIDFGYTGN